MKDQFIASFSKINKTHIQMAIVLVTLVMLVLGAGAVEDFGHIGRR